MAPWVALTAIAVAVLLVGERRSAPALCWIAKPLASAGFVAAALAAGATDSAYGSAILAALCLSWLGDVLLIPKSRTIFRLGILAFLLGHVAFVVAFVVRGVDPAWAIGALAAVAGPLAAVLRWLGPHLGDELRAVVHAYMAVISLMVIAAAGTVGRAGDVTILAGAVAFYLSDLSVARDRFVEKVFANRAWGLPLYYAAQILLASTV